MYFVVLAFFALITLVCLASPIFTGKFYTAAAALVPIILFGIITGFMSATTVGAKSVAIETSFGKYRGTLSSGLNWVAPWASVQQFSTQLQTNKLQPNGDAGAVQVAFKGASNGSADITVRWKITDSGAEALWRDFQTFDHVQVNLVESEVRNATRDVFSQYAPQDAIDGANLTAIDASVKSSLSEILVKRGIKIDSVNVTNIDLGAQAQASINRIVAANSNTQTAEANLNTAKVEAQTAAIQAQSQTGDTLLRHCLDVVEAWDASKSGPLPATFNCAITGATTGTPVIVGQK